MGEESRLEEGLGGRDQSQMPAFIPQMFIKHLLYASSGLWGYSSDEKTKPKSVKLTFW